MSDDQSTKLFKYIEEFREEVNLKLEDNSQAIDRLADTLDGFVKPLDDNETEAAMSNGQFEKLLDWARKVSKKTGIPLENL